jgi:cytochrome c peroxidase
MNAQVMVRLVTLFITGTAALFLGCPQHSPPKSAPALAPASAPRVPERLQNLVLKTGAKPPRDVTNKYADDPRAAALGHKLFFDPRFSGPLLDEANDGNSGTLGKPGDTGKVACASCHHPRNKAFVDSRSPRAQLSLAAGWTTRRTPTLLDVGHVKFLTWDGRRDTFFGLVFTPIESPVEFNSSRLFVAQQVKKLYRSEYEQVFGPIPPLDHHGELSASDAGCATLPRDPAHASCQKPGHDDPEVTRVVVNFGKAIQAYLRLLSCGPSRFDAWVLGDDKALNADEQAGAHLFVGKGGCDGCHSGPHLTDYRFRNVGVAGQLIPFTGVNTKGDQGAAIGLASVRTDPLNSAGTYSDGNDERLKELPADASVKLGAFRTPSLRCVSRRPSYMHDGQYRSLHDVVRFFNRGGKKKGFPGTSENVERNLTKQEAEQLVAFLGALDGTGPDPSLLKAPALP